LCRVLLLVTLTPPPVSLSLSLHDALPISGLSDTSVSTFFHRRLEQHAHGPRPRRPWLKWLIVVDVRQQILLAQRARQGPGCDARDRKSTRLNSSHGSISYAVFCLKKNKTR